MRALGRTFGLALVMLGGFGGVSGGAAFDRDPSVALLLGMTDKRPHRSHPILTASIEIDPPSTPSTGKATGSSPRRSASTYSSGR